MFFSLFDSGFCFDPDIPCREREERDGEEARERAGGGDREREIERQRDRERESERRIVEERQARNLNLLHLITHRCSTECRQCSNFLSILVNLEIYDSG